MADEVQAARLAPQFTHIVIDTGQKPRDVDLQALAQGCDLLILPSVPATLDTEGLVLTIEALNRIGGANFKVLLTKVPPPPEPDGRLPVSEIDDPRAKRGWDAYRAVGEEVLSHV